MNKAIVSPWKITDRARAPTPNTFPATFVAMPCTSASRFVSSSSTRWDDTSMPNHRSVLLETVSSHAGTLPISSCTCSITSGIIAARITTARTNSSSRTPKVASPRRHPRSTSQFTAGSSANERKIEISSHTRRSRIFPSSWKAPKAR